MADIVTECDAVVRRALLEPDPLKQVAMLLKWTLDNIRAGNLEPDRTMALMAGVEPSRSPTEPT